jgi:hypothetical protein
MEIKIPILSNVSFTMKKLIIALNEMLMKTTQVIVKSGGSYRKWSITITYFSAHSKYTTGS